MATPDGLCGVYGGDVYMSCKSGREAFRRRETAQTSAIAAAILSGALIGAFSYYASKKSAARHVKYAALELNSRTAQIPRDLETWRAPGGTSAAEEAVWADLLPVLREAGYEPWPYIALSILRAPTDPAPNGFSLVSSHREHMDGMGSLRDLRQFQYWTPLLRATRTAQGQDVIIRVIVVGDEGREHLEVLRRVAAGPRALLCENHVLPMLRELCFRHVVFGVFPRAAGDVRYAWQDFYRNSVGDIVDFVLQMLEDAFPDNFVVQWHPDSLALQRLSISRPRVYMIDFELAVHFPPERPAPECRCTGYPIGGPSFVPDADQYSRPRALECASGEPYSPFKLDVWQLGTGLAFETGIHPIDEILVSLKHDDPAARPTAKEALESLLVVVDSMTPISLHIAPRSTQEF
ncbi:hypothetical protein DXG01_009372 [Tephrocybe rancida]|nr:hypothetical protein DXG01_009372 [Tephrocybe rancida]